MQVHLFCIHISHVASGTTSVASISFRMCRWLACGFSCCSTTISALPGWLIGMKPGWNRPVGVATGLDISSDHLFGQCRMIRHIVNIWSSVECYRLLRPRHDIATIGVIWSGDCVMSLFSMSCMNTSIALSFILTSSSMTAIQLLIVSNLALLSLECHKIFKSNSRCVKFCFNSPVSHLQ